MKVLFTIIMFLFILSGCSAEAIVKDSHNFDELIERAEFKTLEKIEITDRIAAKILQIYERNEYAILEVYEDELIILLWKEDQGEFINKIYISYNFKKDELKEIYRNTQSKEDYAHEQVFGTQQQYYVVINKGEYGSFNPRENFLYAITEEGLELIDTMYSEYQELEITYMQNHKFAYIQQNFVIDKPRTSEGKACYGVNLLEYKKIKRLERHCVDRQFDWNLKGIDAQQLTGFNQNYAMSIQSVKYSFIYNSFNDEEIKLSNPHSNIMTVNDRITYVENGTNFNIVNPTTNEVEQYYGTRQIDAINYISEDTLLIRLIDYNRREVYVVLKVNDDYSLGLTQIEINGENDPFYYFKTNGKKEIIVTENGKRCFLVDWND